MNLSSKYLVFSLILSTVVLGSLVGCARPATPANEIQSAVSPSPTPQAITPADLAKLRWIEGTWRGTGVTQGPFFERYRFENDTTLVMEELADETLKVTGTTRYELKDGKFGTDRAVATALDDKGITFSPQIKNRNTFRWQTESKYVWKAILTSPGKDGATAKETI